MTVLAAIFLAVIYLVFGISNFSFRPDGTRPVFTAQCPANLSIALDFTLEKHPFSFLYGDRMGYALTYKAAAGARHALYQVGYTGQPDSPGMPSWYSAWQFTNGTYAGPVGTNIFVPLPDQTGPEIRAFARPARTFDQTRPFWNLDNPPFLNIFTDPATMPDTTFQALADCLSANRAAIDDALARLPEEMPARDRHFYSPLTLGGIVHFLPPYTDPAFIRTTEAVWGQTPGDKSIPAQGEFTLHPGESAHGTINRRAITLTLGRDARPTLTADPPLPPIEKLADGWLIPGGICTGDLSRCAKAIDPRGETLDGSQTFVIDLRIGEAAYAEYPRQEEGK